VCTYVCPGVYARRRRGTRVDQQRKLLQKRAERVGVAGVHAGVGTVSRRVGTFFRLPPFVSNPPCHRLSRRGSTPLPSPLPRAAVRWVGQAFTRSLGDLHLHTYGVTHCPEVQAIDLLQVTAPLGGERVNTAQHPCYRFRLHSARPRLVIRSLRPSSGHPQGTTKARARPTLTTQPLPCPRPPRRSTATARRYRRCCAWYCAPTACGTTGHTRCVLLSVNFSLSICVDLIYVCFRT